MFRDSENRQGPVGKENEIYAKLEIIAYLQMDRGLAVIDLAFRGPTLLNVIMIEE